jgi:hypothetical protein
MKKTLYFISTITLLVIGLIYVFVSCSKDEVATKMTISQSTTPQLDIGDNATATITITAEGVKSLKYYKVVDTQRGAATDVTSQVTSSGNTYTYDFTYQLQEFDDLHTLGFEFELTDSKNQVKTVGLAVNINISIKSMFAKYDWKVTASEWLGSSVLTAADGAIVYRFDQDGTYEEDLGAEYAADNHHFCFWVYKETPDNGDTISVLRLIRRLKQGDTAIDEYYDFRITAANESEMTMYWDIAAWGIVDIKNTFNSQAKGAFQPYGTAEMATIVNENASLSCSNIDDGLLTIE